MITDPVPSSSLQMTNNLSKIFVIIDWYKLLAILYKSSVTFLLQSGV